jgi:hypothetical protein
MPVHARLAVLVVISGAVSSLMQAGSPPLETVVAVLLAAAGGVEVGRRLTAPEPALFVRVAVVVLVVGAVVSAVTAGYPTFACVAIVILAAWCTAEIGRRLTGEPYRLPPWSPGWPSWSFGRV